jgi:hypothetical protein
LVEGLGASRLVALVDRVGELPEVPLAVPAQEVKETMARQEPEHLE